MMKIVKKIPNSNQNNSPKKSNHHSLNLKSNAWAKFKVKSYNQKNKRKVKKKKSDIYIDTNNIY